jgi:two-component system NtrC family sensor kinase
MIKEIEKPFVSLSRVLLIRILIASSIITTILTIISYYTDYLSEMDMLQNELKQIEEVSIPSISYNLWQLDFEGMRPLIQNVTKVSSVVGVEVFDEANKLVLSSRESVEEDKYLFQKSYTLKVPESETAIGHLEVYLTKKYIFIRLFHRALVFFGTQGLKTVIVSLIMLYIFSYYVTGHLRVIADYFRKYKHGQRSLVIDHGLKSQNELDILVENINVMAKIVSDEERENRQKLEHHKASAINSARLASLGEMGAGIAHEINNPLAIISGSTNLLKKYLKDKSIQDEHSTNLISRIEKTITRISKIVTSLRAYARQTDMEKKDSVPLDSIIEMTTGLCSEKFKSLAVDFEVQTPIPSIYVHCVAGEISQVLINLLNNAFDAVSQEKESWIRLSFEATEGAVNIVVTNSGPKLDGEIAEKIFQPFFTTKEVGKGTGLGLSLSRSFVENHNGRLYLDPDSSYTRFVVNLPVDS